jgi:hypothetical protein
VLGAIGIEHVTQMADGIVPQAHAAPMAR